MEFRTLEDYVGRTPLVRLKRINAGRNNVILAKLEGNNPAGSVKDRPALSMVMRAEARGRSNRATPDRGHQRQHRDRARDGRGDPRLPHDPGDAGEPERRAPPDHARVRRRARAGAEFGRHGDGARHRRRCATRAAASSSTSSPTRTTRWRTTRGTGPELWEQTGGRITHFVSSMGTTGTIMGTSRFLKERNPDICIVGCEPGRGSSIPGIRKWPEAYLPKIFERPRVDRF